MMWQKEHTGPEYNIHILPVPSLCFFTVVKSVGIGVGNSLGTPTVTTKCIAIILKRHIWRHGEEYEETVDLLGSQEWH